MLFHWQPKVEVERKCGRGQMEVKVTQNTARREGKELARWGKTKVAEVKSQERERRAGDE